MGKIKCIMFDCMETIVDMSELPCKSDYALWAFQGSGCEKYFKDFDEFYDLYKKANEDILYQNPDYKEYSFEYIYEYILKYKNIYKDDQKNIINLLSENYWRNYKRRCYVDKSIINTLTYLNSKYTLGIVSNFKFIGGIEDLLKSEGIYRLFSFIVVSINEGVRKPNSKLYNIAIKKSGFSKNHILFLGDSFENDYKAPEKVGLEAILLDKGKNKEANCKRISKLSDIEDEIEDL